MGSVGGVGAYARCVAVDAGHLCLTPQFLDDAAAAGLPVSIQTAYQLVKGLGDIKNRRILIHGASGVLDPSAILIAKPYNLGEVIEALRGLTAHL